MQIHVDSEKMTGSNICDFLAGTPKPPKKIEDPKKAPNLKFKIYMDGLSVLEHRRMFALISEGCFVPKQTVRNWKAGKARIPVLAQKRIEEIAGQCIF